MVFTKTGLTRRLAYKMLSIVGEKTSMIYLGCFVVTAALTHIMAHTAVAATLYPLLLAIYDLYGEGNKKTKFGQGAFYRHGLCGRSRQHRHPFGRGPGAVGLGFYHEITGNEISFFEYIWYMFPVGWIMTFLLWGFFLIFFKPEKATIPGLKQKAARLNKQLGSLTKHEIISGLIIFGMIAALSLREFVPALKAVDKSGIILTTTVLFFVFGILDINDLEAIPWNIILLFGGAMSIGFCLWQTGAASWLAINWLAMFKEAKLVRVCAEHHLLGLDADQLHHERVRHCHQPAGGPGNRALSGGWRPRWWSLRPWWRRVCRSCSWWARPPTPLPMNPSNSPGGEFFLYGIPASIILMVLIGIVIYTIWPLMGLPVTLAQ